MEDVHVNLKSVRTNGNFSRKVKGGKYLNFYGNTEEDFLENDVSAENLEKAFTDYRHYLAMKSLTKLEKMVLYTLIIELVPLGVACKKLKMTKYEVIKTKEKALKHFRNNLIKICKTEENTPQKIKSNRRKSKKEN